MDILSPIPPHTPFRTRLTGTGRRGSTLLHQLHLCRSAMVQRSSTHLRMFAPAPRIRVPAPSAAMTFRNASNVEVYFTAESPPTVIIILRRIVSNGYLASVQLRNEKLTPRDLPRWWSRTPRRSWPRDCLSDSRGGGV